MADGEVQRKITTDVTKPMDKIGKMTLDVEDHTEVAEFLEYLASLLRKRKRIIIFVQSDESE